MCRSRIVISGIVMMKSGVKVLAGLVADRYGRCDGDLVFVQHL